LDEVVEKLQGGKAHVDRVPQVASMETPTDPILRMETLEVIREGLRERNDAVKTERRGDPEFVENPSIAELGDTF
jgi:hypothetical protein